MKDSQEVKRLWETNTHFDVADLKLASHTKNMLSGIQEIMKSNIV